MRQRDLEEWLCNPVTKEMVELLQEHRDACNELLHGTLDSINSLKDMDIYKMAEFRAQVRTLDMLINTKDFLTERVEGKNETHNIR